MKTEGHGGCLLVEGVGSSGGAGAGQQLAEGLACLGN